ncbi:MAG: hypothetical protein ACJAVA_002175 [Flavobacteriaceae bacterium]|jgi:hypothetical protein
MTKSEIKKYHQIIGYLNLILSLHYLIFSRENHLIERVFAVIAINVGYHMTYYFFSGIYRGSTRMRNHNEFNNNIRGIILKIFATFGIFASIFLLSVFISNTICFDQYLNLYAICIPFGFFLGAYSLGTHLKNK